MHLAIASEIEQRSHNRLSEVSETLAHHYGKTNRLDKRFDYSCMAGEKSMGVYSLGDAQQYFYDALKLFENAPSCTNNANYLRLFANITSVLTMTFHPGELVRLVDRHKVRISAATTP